MQCPCGRMTIERVATYRGADLTYEHCRSCGRNGQWLLIRDGQVLERGETARARFVAMKAKAA